MFPIIGEVVIRTNSYDTALTVNAPLDTIHHYGQLMSANLQKVSSSSYYEHGDTNLVEIASGRLVITNDANAEVGNVYLTATNDNYKVEEVGIIIATQTGAKLPDVIRRDAVTETDGKVVCTIQTNVDAKGENPQKVDIVTIKGEDNVQEATKGYTNVAELTKMVLEAPTGSEVAGASEYIGNDVAVATEEKQGVINEAKGTVIEVTFHNEVTLLTISEFRDQWNAGEFFDLENPVSVRLTGNVYMKKIGNWGPIGTWEYPFFGTFDGQKSETENYTIANLSNHANADANGYYTHIYYNNSSVGYGETYGFFGIVGGGDTTIQNVTFDNVDINIVNGKNVGAVIGYIPNNGNFTNADSKKGAYNLGFISYDKWAGTEIGSHNITLSGITVSGSISAKSQVAGMVAKIYSTGEVIFTNCTNNASLIATSDGYAGGIAGYVCGPTNLEATNCHNTGSIISHSNAVGGIVGAHTEGTGTFTTCSNSGNITCNLTATGNSIGGILGKAGSNYAFTFEDCSNSGDLTDTGTIDIGGGANDVAVGGILGSKRKTGAITLKGTIENTGKISGYKFAGGIIGCYTSSAITIGEMANISSTGTVTVTDQLAHMIEMAGENQTVNDTTYASYSIAARYWVLKLDSGTKPNHKNQAINVLP